MTSAEQRLFERAVASLQAGALLEAERGFVQFLLRHPRHFGALNLLGIVLIRQARYSEAESIIRRACSADSRSDTTHYNHGIVLKALDRPVEALEALDRAIAINPSVPESWNNRGTVLNDLRRFEEALQDFDRAIALKPNYAEALVNAGNALAELDRSDEALVLYERALAIGANLAEAWSGRGNALFKLRRYDEALASMDRAYAIKSEIEYLAGLRQHVRMYLCDWSDFESRCSQIVDGVRAGHRISRPFDLLAVPSTASDQLNCARIFVRRMTSANCRPLWKGERYRHNRIRLGYISADFRMHAVSHLAVRLFEGHDRKKFETFAISLNATDNSGMRARLENAFDHFIDASRDNSEAIARKMQALEIDIAIDLMGHTAGARTEILAFRPCPVQVSYLGFAATMGADFVDYIIADPIVMPKDQQCYFSEQVIRLPETFMPYDSTLKISDLVLKRADQGLPESGFVFCAYNNSYKINPQIFDIWMRLLRTVDGSVLWLSGAHDTAVLNLRAEAKSRGIDVARLIFAKRLPRIEEHLGRHRLADLFLDTLPYNAHSTAVDALWAGLPVLTCRGETFAGRVASSLLQAAGLAELITENLAEYEALALKIAREPALLAAVKAKLARNRDTHPLFDTACFVRNVELAYTAMWERYQRGETPQGFSVRTENYQ